MTMRRFGIALAATLAVGALAARGRAEDPPAGGADPMAAYMKMHEPGPAQAQLEKLEGAWSATTRFFGPTGEMMDEGKGSSENAMILGGRHLETWYSGSMMGMPFEGRGLLSHDNFDYASRARSVLLGKRQHAAVRRSNPVTFRKELSFRTGKDIAVQ